VVILNGIPLDRFRRSARGLELRARLGVPGTDPVVGMVGPAHRPEGHRGFPADARQVAMQRPATRFWIIGEGEERGRYEAMAREFGLANRVVFWGNRTDVPDLMAALDLYLMTSRWEPFGLVLLEAMAAEVPILGFLRRWVAWRRSSGTARPPACSASAIPAALAGLVVRYLEDAGARRRLTLAASADVRSRFDIRRMAASYAHLYWSLSGRAGGVFGGGEGGR